MKKVCHILFFLLLSSHLLLAQSKANDNYILVLHSINFSDAWTLGVYEAIQNTYQKDGLKVKGVELQIPAIKTMEEVNLRLEELKETYPSPKLVICIGDPSWLMCRPLFDSCWKEKPTLLCYSRKWMPIKMEYLIERKVQNTETMILTKELLSGYNTAILNQPLYIKETVKIMQKVQPEMKRIAFICDNRYVSIRTAKELQDTLTTSFPSLHLNILSTPAISTENLLDSLDSYGKETGIIYYSWYVSKKSGENKYLIDNLKKMTNSFSIPPVFLINDQDIESGHFAGGHYISSESFSAALIKVIRQILSGKQTRDISIKTLGEPKTYLNYQHLLSHGIDPALFPKEAIYVEAPPTFFEKYKIHMLSGTAIFTLLICLMILHFRLKTQHKRQQEKEREAAILIEKELHEKEKAEEANRLKSAFLANISHEIRTPLNAIVGFSHLITSGECPDEDRQEICEIIETNNELLLNLINDILDLSKIEAGKMEFNFTYLNVKALSVQLTQTFKGKVKPNVKFICSLPDNDCWIYSEKNRLTQVLTNFLSNACKYTDQGSITLGYEQIEGGLRFYVVDTGKGIAKENLPHVFERFAKFDSFVQGTGLGLSICKTIIQRLKGEIGVDSEEGKGCCFWFTIPNEVTFGSTPPHTPQSLPDDL